MVLAATVVDDNLEDMRADSCCPFLSLLCFEFDKVVFFGVAVVMVNEGLLSNVESILKSR